MAKTKVQKRTEAKKNAEALKAKKKALRMQKAGASSNNGNAKKGRSAIPQSKKR